MATKQTTEPGATGTAKTKATRTVTPEAKKWLVELPKKLTAAEVEYLKDFITSRVKAAAGDETITGYEKKLLGDISGKI